LWKQSVATADLDIQGGAKKGFINKENKFRNVIIMRRKRTIEYILLVCLLIFLAGCSRNIQMRSSGAQKGVELTGKDQINYNYFFTEALKLKMGESVEDIQKALAYYRKCLEINPDSDASMYQISNILVMGGDYKNAMLYAKKATEIDPGNIWYQLLLANLYHAVDKQDSAIVVYNNILEKNPERIDLYFNLAGLHGEYGNIRKALKIYEELEKKYGKNAKISIAKEQIYSKVGKGEKAENELIYLIQTYPEELGFYVMLAELYSARDMDEKAKEIYNTIFRKDPDNGLAQLSVVEFYRKKGEYREGFNILDKIINNNSINIEEKIEMMISFISDQRELKEHKKEVNQALGLLKNKYHEDYRIRVLYANYYIRLSMHEDAAEELRYVVENVKDNYMVWEQLMFVENALGEYERLYEESIEAIKIFPMAPNLYLFKGIACIEKGNEDEAIETLKTGLKIAGKNKDLITQLYSMLGEAYRNKGQNHLSDDAFNKVLEIDKKNLYVLNNYSYYLSLREEKLEEALEMSKVCIEQEPENSTYLDTYAWILFKMKNYKEAKKYLELALKNNGSKNSEIVEHYGDVLFFIGKKETALEYWKKAKELGKISGELDRKISDVEGKNGNQNH